jgi:hypothetical protein
VTPFLTVNLNAQTSHLRARKIPLRITARIDQTAKRHTPAPPDQPLLFPNPPNSHLKTNLLFGAIPFSFPFAVPDAPGLGLLLRLLLGLLLSLLLACDLVLFPD